MHTPEVPPPGNHLSPAGASSRGRFLSSPPSRQSSSKSSPLSVVPSSLTPKGRRPKSPIPETTPTRLRQHITMTTGASESILGLQRTRKPLSPTDNPSVPTGISLPSQDEPLPNQNPLNPPAPPNIALDAASEYAPIRPLAAFGEWPPARPSPQLDSYNVYPGIPSYPMVGGPPTHQHFHPHGPYYRHATPSYQPPSGLAAPRHDFARSQSPN